jgi:hypothetical protein
MYESILPKQRCKMVSAGPAGVKGICGVGGEVWGRSAFHQSDKSGNESRAHLGRGVGEASRVGFLGLV